MSTPCAPLLAMDPDSRRVLCHGGYDLLLIDRRRGPSDQVHTLLLEVLPELCQLLADTDAVALPVQRYECCPFPLVLPLSLPYSANGCYVTLLALEMPNSGHYAGAFITSSTVTIYDSMTTAEGNGRFGQNFVELATRLFPRRRVRIAPLAAGEQALQPTGGFLSVPASFVPLDADPLITLFNVESQDHFCYGWALFQLHARFLNYNLAPLRRRLATNVVPALVLIKIYCWQLLSFLNLTSSFPDTLVADYFAIWDAEDRLDSEDYRRYTFSLSAPPPATLDDCFEDALAFEASTLQRIEARRSTPSGCRATLRC